MGPVSLFDFEALAKQRMSHNFWDFVEAGAADEVTVRRNRSAFDEVAVRPRFLVDVGERDLSTTVLGKKISFPVMIAPAGGQRGVHPEGERAAALAAGAAGIVYALATGSGFSMEEVAEVATGPLWFQLYHSEDKVTEHLLARAEAAGYAAICLTIDVPVPSPRERDLRNGFSALRELSHAHLEAYAEESSSLMRISASDSPDWTPPHYQGLTWSRLDWLRSLTNLPLVIKGIRTTEDAILCAEHGADGIVVSTHGGRQLDCTLSSIETLPAIVDAVGDKLEVYLDSGVRRGQDVLKALAIGARAVLIGRPVFWGLAVDGEVGVRRVLQTLRVEFDCAMAYCGRTSVAQLDRSLVSLPCGCRS